MAQVSAQTASTSILDNRLTQIEAVTNTEPPETLRERDWSRGLPADIDIDPPVIDHEAIETGVPGQAQQFSAKVIDDRGLQHVMLFYRDSPGIQYQSATMQQVPASSEFIVSVPTSLGQNQIEYYIEALDTGGNRVLKGFPFFPLVRELQSTAPINVSDPTSNPKSALIYVLIGAAVVGLVLALSGGSDNTVEEPPAPGTVPLTINVTAP